MNLNLFSCLAQLPANCLCRFIHLVVAVNYGSILCLIYVHIVKIEEKTSRERTRSVMRTFFFLFFILFYVQHGGIRVVVILGACK